MGKLKLENNLKENCIKFLQRLIQTESYPGKEKTIAELVVSEMKSINYDEAYIDEAGNVIGKINGEGKADPIMFNTHLDHVDVGDPKRWPHPPFGAEIHDGSIWGRGAVDIKGPLAAQVYGVVSAFQKNGKKPLGDIYVTSVVQEEIGGVGAQHLVTHLKPKYVIVGEPSSNKIMRGHRGRLEILIKFKGYSVHASAPDRGVNPLKVAANFIINLGKIEMAFDEELGFSSVALTKITSDQESTNVIPAEVDLICDWRNVPSESGKDVLEKLNSIVNLSLIEGATAEVTIPKYNRKTYTGMEMEVSASNYPFKTNKEDKLVTKTYEILKNVRNETEIPRFWKFTTDGGHFNRAGLKIIGYGPGNEKLAHTIHERIPIKEVEDAILGNQALASQLQRLIN